MSKISIPAYYLMMKLGPYCVAQFRYLKECPANRILDDGPEAWMFAAFSHILLMDSLHRTTKLGYTDLSYLDANLPALTSRYFPVSYEGMQSALRSLRPVLSDLNRDAAFAFVLQGHDLNRDRVVAAFTTAEDIDDRVKHGLSHALKRFTLDWEYEGLVVNTEDRRVKELFACFE